MFFYTLSYKKQNRGATLCELHPDCYLSLPPKGGWGVLLNFVRTTLVHYSFLLRITHLPSLRPPLRVKIPFSWRTASSRLMVFSDTLTFWAISWIVIRSLAFMRSRIIPCRSDTSFKTSFRSSFGSFEMPFVPFMPSFMPNSGVKGFSITLPHILVAFYFFICVLSNFLWLLLILLILLVLTSNITPTLNICQCCHFFNPAHSLYILWINKENIPQIDIQPIFKCYFCSFLAKFALKSIFNIFSHVPYRIYVPELSLLPSWMGIVTKNIKWKSFISKDISNTHYI